MSRINLTNALIAEYFDLFQTLEIAPEHFSEVDEIVDRLLAHKTTYKTVADEVNAPWFFVGVIHNMESSLNFECHLHNGDSLGKRTHHVPKNRPAKGNPPFTWEESAIDALQLRRIDRVDDWSLGRLLYELEGYNGWGYRKFHQHVKSPYLWSFSNHYTRGKYVRDGTWSDTAVSAQCGAAVLVKRLEQRGEIPLFSERVARRVTPLRFSNREIARADDLQRFLNTFPGISLRVDSTPGEKTSDAVEQIFGFRLEGDPRAPAGN
jgi:lysozyme family protein